MLGNYRSEKVVQPLIDCYEDLGIDECLRSLAYIGGGRDLIPDQELGSGGRAPQGPRRRRAVVL